MCHQRLAYSVCWGSTEYTEYKELQICGSWSVIVRTRVRKWVWERVREKSKRNDEIERQIGVCGCCRQCDGTDLNAYGLK